MPSPWETALKKEFALFERLQEGIPKWKVNIKADAPADQRLLELSAAAWVAKATKSYAAIGLLCRHGFGEDALSLLRGLYELLLNFLYLNVSPDEQKNRLQRLLDYIVLQREEKLRLVQEVPPEDPALTKWAEKEAIAIRADVEEITKRRPENEIKKLRRNWRHQSARKIAEDNRLLQVHTRIYRSGSEGLHGADVTHWLTEGPDSNPKMETEPSASWVDTVIQIAPQVMLDILRQANHLLNLNLSLPSTEAR